jgi:hypothetical protein
MRLNLQGIQEQLISLSLSTAFGAETEEIVPWRALPSVAKKRKLAMRYIPFKII